MALTDTQIRNAKPKLKPYTLFDGQGLYLLIQPNGAKLWRWKYRYEGKPRLMALGQYPQTSLAMAHNAHHTARKMLASGVNPMAAKKANKQAVKAEAEAEQRNAENSFKAVALKWHKHWSTGDDVSEDTAAYIMRRLEADVFPVFDVRPMDSIKPLEIFKLIERIGERARDVAQRQLGTLQQIYRYAVTRQLAETNPAATFKPSDVLAPRKTQNRAHIDPSGLSSLLVAIDEYNGKPLVRYALKLMALTFVRTSELIEAPWSEFDLDNARWTVTKERMKMDKPHIVPLSKQAIEILRELKQLAGDKTFVFPGMNKQSKNKTINCNSLLNALGEIGYKGIMTGHGFRGLASTILHEHGFEDAHVELQLSHSKKNKVAASYDHAKYLPQRAQLMQWWADYLDTVFLSPTRLNSQIRASAQSRLAVRGEISSTAAASSKERPPM